MLSKVSRLQRLLHTTVAAFRRKMQQQQERIVQIASLEFDSWGNAAPLGARGTHDGQQLLYSTTDFDVDIEVRSSKDHGDLVTLHGQILATKPSLSNALLGLECQLEAPEFDSRTVLTNQYGRFHISLLERGTYSLRVVHHDRDILIQPLTF